MTFILTATAAFLGTFLALAVGIHMHVLGCHRRPDGEGYPVPRAVRRATK